MGLGCFLLLEAVETGLGLGTHFAVSSFCFGISLRNLMNLWQKNFFTGLEIVYIQLRIGVFDFINVGVMRMGHTPQRIPFQFDTKRPAVNGKKSKKLRNKGYKRAGAQD
ncbi:MAG: hypothetical protein R2877_07780 [Bdellovibrionota bacterium]